MFSLKNTFIIHKSIKKLGYIICGRASVFMLKNASTCFKLRGEFSFMFVLFFYMDAVMHSFHFFYILSRLGSKFVPLLKKQY